MARLAALLAAAAVAGAAGHALRARDEPDEPSTIHIIPRLMPHHDYDEHMKKLYKAADEDFVLHSDKLEKQNSKLKRRVLALETALGREHGSKAALEEEQEFDLAISSGTEYDQSRNRSVGKAVTLVMLSTIIVGALLTVMTASRQPKPPFTTVKAKTWRLIEKVVIVFVVVLWSQVVDNFFHWVGVSLHHETLFSAIHAVLVFVLLVLLSVRACRVQDNGRMMEVISAVGVHYYAFMALHAGGNVQDAFFSKYIWLCLLGIPCVVLLLAGLSSFTRWILMRELPDEDADHFIDKIEELEDDAHGMVMAFLVTMFVRFAICGKFDAHAEGETGELGHSSASRFAMLAYACFMVGLTIWLLPRLHHFGLVLQGVIGGYLAQRMMLILNPFLCTSVAWSFILWADWEFYEHLFRGDPVLGRIVWALVCTVGCLLAVAAFAVQQARAAASGTSYDKEDATVNLAWRWHDLEKRKNVLNAVAVLVAFSWAQVLIASVGGATAGSAHPLVGLALVTVLLSATGYFLYARYILPAVFLAQEAEEH